MDNNLSLKGFNKAFSHSFLVIYFKTLKLYNISDIIGRTKRFLWE